MKIHLGEISGWALSGTGIEALGNRVAQLASGQYTPDLDYVPLMGGYVAPNTASGIGATISASAEFSNFWRSWYAFRNGQPSLALGWIGSVVDTGWLRSTFNASIIVNKVTIQAINDGNYVRSPIDFTIRGSNDGFVADDNVLLTVIGEPAWSQNEKRSYTFPNYTEYAAYEIRITDSDGFEPGIGEMEMMFKFATGSPVAESTELTIDGVLDAVTPIVVDDEVTGAGNVKFQYKIDGGAYNGVWLTEAALNAALAGQSISTLQIKIQFNSDGTGKARVHNSPTYTEVTVSCDFPAIADVRSGTVYDSGNLTGILDLPGILDVRDGTDYDNATKTGTLDLPLITDVRLGTDYDNATKTGTVAIPDKSDVRVAIPVDATTGDYVPAGVGIVLENEQYGSLGTEFTGTLVPTQASYELPQEVIIEGDEIVIIEGCE